MRAALAGVMGGFQNLDHDDAHERPVDRLSALAAAQIARAEDAQRGAILASLGVELIRFKDARIDAARLDAEDLLSAVLVWHQRSLDLSDLDRTRVARWAIHEWANDSCPPRPNGCGGAGEVPDHSRVEGKQPMRVCPVCSGSRMRYWSDDDRIRAIGRPFPRAMAEAHTMIARASSLAVERAKQLLERC